MASEGPPTVATPPAKLFEVKSGDIFFQAFYSRPVFGLLQNAPSLSEQLFARLNRHGLRLSDIKIENGLGTLNEAQATASFLSLSTVVKIRLDTIEVNCFNARAVAEEQIGDLVIGALEAVKLHAPTLIFDAYTFALGMHGLLQGTTAVDFLQGFSNPPESRLGPLSGTGMVLYYGPSEGRLRAAVTADLSGVIDGALFLRPTAVWQASAVPISSLPTLGRAFIDDAMKQFNIEVRWES